MSTPSRHVAGAWLVRNGRILLLQRSGGMSDGLWVPPGGNVDPGEEPLAAAVREALEETGLVLAQPTPLRSWTWERSGPVHVHHFVGVAEGPIVRISAEHYDFDWLSPAEYIARHLAPLGEGQWAGEMAASAEMVAAWMNRIE